MKKYSRTTPVPAVPCAKQFPPEFDIGGLPSIQGFVRSRLRKAGINTFGDLTLRTEEELRSIPGVGTTTVKYLLFVRKNNEVRGEAS